MLASLEYLMQSLEPMHDHAASILTYAETSTGASSTRFYTTIYTDRVLCGNLSRRTLHSSLQLLLYSADLQDTLKLPYIF